MTIMYEAEMDILIDAAWVGNLQVQRFFTMLGVQLATHDGRQRDFALVRKDIDARWAALMGWVDILEARRGGVSKS